MSLEGFYLQTQVISYLHNAGIPKLFHFYFWLMFTLHANKHIECFSYIFLLFVFLYQYGTRLSSLHQCDKGVRSKVIKKLV